jgi:hypothetical protein
MPLYGWLALAAGIVVILAGSGWLLARHHRAAGPGRAAPRQARADQPAPRQTRTYQALVTLLPSGEGSPPPGQPWQYWRAVVRARDHRTRAARILAAQVSAQDDPVPGRSRLVTMVVTGRDLGSCLGVGDRFTLWRGTDVARGVITQRLFVA